jgi:hypothetical protein
MVHFYELQLILLSAFCLFTISVERFLSNASHKRRLTAGDRAEIGKTSNLRAVLARQYLVVYAIVMGE